MFIQVCRSQAIQGFKGQQQHYLKLCLETDCKSGYMGQSDSDLIHISILYQMKFLKTFQGQRNTE